VTQRERRVRQLEARYAAWEAEAFGAWLGSLSEAQKITFFNRILASLASMGLAPPPPDHLWEAPLAEREVYLACLRRTMELDDAVLRPTIRHIWRAMAAVGSTRAEKGVVGSLAP
jgi:hypothetical protein